MMTPSRTDFQGSARGRLTPHVREIVRIGALAHGSERLREIERTFAFEGKEQLFERAYDACLDVGDERRLRGVVTRNVRAMNSRAARDHELRQDAARGVHRAAQRELAQEEDSRQRLDGDAPKRRECRCGYREVEARSGLAYVCGCKVDDDATLRDVHAELSERALDAHATLTNRGFREADEFE